MSKSTKPPGKPKPSKTEAMLARIKPFDQWKAERPRSDADVKMYHRIVDELKKLQMLEKGKK